MKERIKIKNFSVLDDVDIEIHRINILIGPQATGKSLIGKLIYFFKSDVIFEMFSAIISNQEISVLNQKLRDRFHTMFPSYILSRKPFEVSYFFGDHVVSFSNEKNKSSRSMKITYSDKISKEFAGLKRAYIKQIKPGDSSGTDFAEKSKPEDMVYDHLYRLFFGGKKFAYYIPAGRSFFINIEKQVFSLLTYQYDVIDYILKAFGGVYQNIKNKYANTKQLIGSTELYRASVEILGGEYEYDDREDWLKTKENEKISLMHTSSGQQELVPMLLALHEPAAYRKPSFIVIEEPEAHLFPESQYRIVEIIAMVYNLLQRNSGFLITTHSPYILTAFNNLIMADNCRLEIMKRFKNGEIDDKKKDQQVKKLDEIVTPGKRVAFNDISIYEVKNGKCLDIKDKENKLISADIIDGIFDTSALIFDRLLDIAFGDE